MIWRCLRPIIMAVSSKYQWATIPLAMHGVIIKKNGETVELNLGEKLVIRYSASQIYFLICLRSRMNGN